MNFYSCNDKADRGSYTLIARRWFWSRNTPYFGDEVQVELNIPSKSFHLGISVSKAYVADNTIVFTFCIPPVSLYVGITWDWLEKTKFWTWITRERIVDRSNKETLINNGREVVNRYHRQSKNRHAQYISLFDIRIVNWIITWAFYQDKMRWRSDTSKWRYGSFSILDFFVGKSKKTEIFINRDVMIPTHKGGLGVTGNSHRWYVTVDDGYDSFRYQIIATDNFSCREAAESATSKLRGKIIGMERVPVHPRSAARHDGGGTLDKG